MLAKWNVFVNQRNGKKQRQVVVDHVPSPQWIDGSWNVEFDPDWGAPEKVAFPELISWTDHENIGIKFYSGKGVYSKKISVPDDWTERRTTHLFGSGQCRRSAEVYINGKSAGIVWKPPYRTEITQLGNTGENDLKVEIMNLWINRLTGDMNLPVNERFTKTNIRSDGATPKILPSPGK